MVEVGCKSLSVAIALEKSWQLHCKHIYGLTPHTVALNSKILHTGRPTSSLPVVEIKLVLDLLILLCSALFRITCISRILTACFQNNGSSVHSRYSLSTTCSL